jgi:hypothetical protein
MGSNVLGTLFVLSSIGSLSSAHSAPLIVGPDFNSKYSVADYWPGEYPSGIQVRKSVTVKGYDSFLFESESPRRTLSCALPGGLMLHPWSMNQDQAATMTDFFYVSSITRYRSQADHEINFTDDYSDEGVKVRIGKNEVLEELNYLAEGQCRVRVPRTDDRFAYPCFSNNEDLYKVVENQSPQSWEMWAGVQCLGGEKVYLPIEASENSRPELLAEIERLKSLGVSSSRAMVKGFGEVTESRTLSVKELRERALSAMLNKYSPLAVKHIAILGADFSGGHIRFTVGVVLKNEHYYVGEVIISTTGKEVQISKLMKEDQLSQ